MGGWCNQAGVFGVEYGKKECAMHPCMSFSCDWGAFMEFLSVF